MSERNLLLSGGEKLASRAEIVRGSGDKKRPYSIQEVRDALLEPLRNIEERLEQVASDAKPRGEGVFELTLHPTYLARSYYPADLLNATGLRDLGSKEKAITPRKVTEERLAGKPHSTASLFVAGNEAGIRKFREYLTQADTSLALQKKLVTIESVNWIEGISKLKGALPNDEAKHSFEVALHAGATEDDIVIAFQRLARRLNASVDLSRRIRAGGLTFVPVTATAAQMTLLSEFTFLRVARLMPELRMSEPLSIRQTMPAFPFVLPKGAALNTQERAAIFDGGLGTSDLSPWTIETVYEETAVTVGPLLMHGSEVTSTFLFGRAINGHPTGVPYMNVDHYRVLSPLSGHDPDLFDVLLRIKNVLETGNYRFANLSLGPRMPIEDDEVHAWTATLDQICANFEILVTVAVGNDGTADGANRIQPPGDMVNALAIGACDSAGAKWKRAPYSCIGPGRSPGFVKPDGVAFGGSESELFTVFNPFLQSVVGVQGTSYSAPLTLRTAAGVAALTTFDLPSIALKALLIHHADTASRLSRGEIGWGRFKENCAELLECSADSATIVFKATLAKGEYRRCPIPFPDLILPGKVGIKATFCINAHTDPEHAVNYTRAGVGITFRPRHGIGEKSTSDFFGINSQYKNSEREQRDAAHKWETVLHRDRSFNDSSSLAEPVFDIEYHARASSRSVAPKSAPDVSFALVITLHAPGVPNLYNLIRQKYPVLTPVEIRANVQIES
jgi:hypothetical protein